MKKAPTKQVKPIPFYKLHGAGNDILVVEAKYLPKSGKAKKIQAMAQRQLGIGSDQVIEVLSRKPLKLQVWNQDGTKAEMCGNGVRALMHLASLEKWLGGQPKEVPLVISGKPYKALKAAQGYEISLGEPTVAEKQLFNLNGEIIPFTEVSVGNPHAVIFFGQDDWEAPTDFYLRYYGPRIESHERFPKKTNVEFVRSWSKKGKVVEALVEVWERGAGATLSCGSGAVAVAAALRKRAPEAREFRVKMTDYELKIRFEGGKAFLSGPSALVAKGIFY